MYDSIAIASHPLNENPDGTADEIYRYQALLESLFQPAPAGVRFDIQTCDYGFNQSYRQVIIKFNTAIPAAESYALLVEKHIPLSWDVPASEREKIKLLCESVTTPPKPRKTANTLKELASVDPLEVIFEYDLHPALEAAWESWRCWVTGEDPDEYDLHPWTIIYLDSIHLKGLSDT